MHNYDFVQFRQVLLQIRLKKKLVEIYKTINTSASLTQSLKLGQGKMAAIWFHPRVLMPLASNIYGVYVFEQHSYREQNVRNAPDICIFLHHLPCTHNLT